ncbi:MAG: DUF1499 domain-containing protein [Pseudomonadota bacterium]
MRLLLLLPLAAIVAALVFAAYVRLAPSDPMTWHTDPAQARPALGHFVVLPEGGDAPSPRFAASPADVLEALDAVALATPRTTRLAGSPQEGRITYVTRSRLWGFPDYTTVAAQPVDGGTALVLHARLRFGQSDLGVNAARVEVWLNALQDAMPSA